ncbi:MAG: DUF6644 family protein [Pseudomonadota bacterium]
MYEAMLWLEGSALAEGLRGLGVWSYGIINLLHILGIGTLFGAVLILDLRLLGAWNSITVATIARPTVPLAACGFFVAVCSGVSMFSINATEYHGNPFFYIKLPTLLAALINIGIVTRVEAWRRAVLGADTRPGDQRILALVGAISLFLWLVVLSCGRMIGYW